MIQIGMLVTLLKSQNMKNIFVFNIFAYLTFLWQCFGTTQNCRHANPYKNGNEQSKNIQVHEPCRMLKAELKKMTDLNFIN